MDELYEDTVFEDNIQVSKYIKINDFKQYKFSEIKSLVVKTV